VLSAGFNASTQSSWKVVNNAAKVLYFILAHPVVTRIKDLLGIATFSDFYVITTKDIIPTDFTTQLY
jgi:hypothetical protein